MILISFSFCFLFLSFLIPSFEGNSMAFLNFNRTPLSPSRSQSNSDFSSSSSYSSWQSFCKKMIHTLNAEENIFTKQKQSRTSASMENSINEKLGIEKEKGGAIQTHGLDITFLESNTWLWRIKDFTILVDPVMYQLDFGAPNLIKGKKSVVNGDKILRSLANEVDLVLISQGFDDHCHEPTLKIMKDIMPNVPIIGPPSAKSLLESYFAPSQIDYLKPGELKTIKAFDNSKDGEENKITITATTGDTLGPPWFDPENGYIINFPQMEMSSSKVKVKSLYYEPHCRFDTKEFQDLQIQSDIVITPVIKQLLFGAYPVVDGQEKAIDLIEALQGKVVIPMNNGDLDLSESSLFVTQGIRRGGSISSFLTLLKERLPGVLYIDTPPGKNVQVLSY